MLTMKNGLAKTNHGTTCTFVGDAIRVDKIVDAEPRYEDTRSDGRPQRRFITALVTVLQVVGDKFIPAAVNSLRVAIWLDRHVVISSGDNAGATELESTGWDLTPGAINFCDSYEFTAIPTFNIESYNDKSERQVVKANRRIFVDVNKTGSEQAERSILSGIAARQQFSAPQDNDKYLKISTNVERYDADGNQLATGPTVRNQHERIMKNLEAKLNAGPKMKV